MIDSINPARRVVQKDGTPTIAALRQLAMPRMPPEARFLRVRVYERFAASDEAAVFVAEAAWRGGGKHDRYRDIARTTSATRAGAMAALAAMLDAP